MRKTIGVILTCIVVGVLVTFTTTSCNKNEFDKEVADTMKLITFHNDKVDPNHTWSLINDWGIKVLANSYDVKRIEILSKNPYTSVYSEILATREASENELVNLYYSVPTMCDSIYVAAVNSKGEYTIVAAPYMTPDVVNFNKLNTTNSGHLNIIRNQKVYYCYDLSYPEPSNNNWSYHDIVMSLSKEYVNEYVMRITVTLHALGTTKQVAAGLRLSGVKYEKVEQIYVEGENKFVKDPDAERYIIKDKDLLLKAHDGSAVINLFDDAHAAFFNQYNDNGTVTRYKFNVSHTSGPEYMGFPEVTVTYTVVFNEPELTTRIGFTNFDLFASYFYITAPWEVHKYRYKFQETLAEYYGGNQYAYADKFTWALEIPYSQFRYPTVGNAMGSYKNGVSYGAYNKLNHSFGEWGTNMNNATDWFLYPNSAMVY